MAFLQTSGTDFVVNGKKYVPFGASIYTSIWNSGHITNRLNEGVALHLNIFRMVNYSTPDDTGFEEATWVLVDHALNQARLNNVRILLDFSDYLVITAVEHGWVEALSNADWSVFLAFVLNRVNTINGQVYKNDDALGIITIAGEINSAYNAHIVDFYTTVSQQIKAIDTNHVVASGGTEYYHPYAEVAAIPTLDAFSSHPYENNLGYNNKMESSMRLYGIASRNNNKPWFMEEFGEPGGTGDHHRAVYMRKLYQWGLKYGCGGFLFWNLAPNNGVSGFDVGESITPRTWKTIKLHSYLNSFSPRVPVDEAISAGYSG